MKKILSLLTAILFLTVWGGCSSVSVHSDYDPDVDFFLFEGYDWLKPPNNLKVNYRNKLENKKIIKAIEGELNRKGYHKKTSKKPDFLITFHLNVVNKVEVTDWGYSYRRGRSWVKRIETEPYKEKTLVLDIIDPVSKELIWRGWDQSKLRPGDADHTVAEFVRQILRDFPPEEN